MNVAEVRSLAHGERVQENGRGGKVGVVECVSEKYLRIRWEGGDYTAVDLANALECSFYASNWSRLKETPAPPKVTGPQPARYRRKGKPPA